MKYYYNASNHVAFTSIFIIMAYVVRSLIKIQS